MNLFFDVLYNLGILVALSIISGLLEDKLKQSRWRFVVQGFLFGTAALIGMLNPVVLSPGLIFDGRSIVISLAALYYGPVAALVAALMAAVLRIAQGGVGTLMGVLVITASALWGVLFWMLTPNRYGTQGRRKLYFFGVLVHVTMLLLAFVLPWDRAVNTFVNMGVPVLVLYPLATVLIGIVLNQFLSQRETMTALVNSEQKIRRISDNLQDGMIYKVLSKPDGSRVFTYLSDSVRQLYGHSPEEVMADSALIYTRVHPDDQGRLAQEERVSTSTLTPFRCEVRVVEPSGSIRWSALVSTPHQEEDGSIIYDGIEFVITDRKSAEEKSLQSLREKETLIGELYHRTKNTMQIISGLLMMQADKHPENTELQSLVSHTRDRIQAISLVHQMLIKSRDLSRISIREYITELASLILQSYEGTSDRISLHLAIEDETFLIDTAVPLGLILNELMTNSLKYGYPEKRRGQIRIVLETSSDQTQTLTYCDDGVGLPQGLNLDKLDSLGLKLIHAIGEKQLHGRIEMHQGPGFHLALIFLKDLYAARV